MKRIPALAASTPGTTNSVEDTRRLTIRAAIRSALDALRERQETRRKELEELKKRFLAEKERMEELSRQSSVTEFKKGGISYSKRSFSREPIEKLVRAAIERREQAKRAFANRVVQGVREVYGGNAAPFYRAAGLSRSAYSKIISHSDHKPSKETVLAMAAALDMNLGDAKAFLHLVGYSLSEYVLEDVIWATCFEHGVHRLNEIKSLLAEFGNAAPSGSTEEP